MKRKPVSYGEILERTVPDPSGAFAPSRDERRQAAHRGEPVFHPMRPHEHALAQQIYTELAKEPRIDRSHIEIVVQGAVAHLTGSVPGPATVALVEDVVGQVHGIERVVSDLVCPEGSAS